jgi:hypothetical protein
MATSAATSRRYAVGANGVAVTGERHSAILAGQHNAVPRLARSVRPVRSRRQATHPPVARGAKEES